MKTENANLNIQFRNILLNISPTNDCSQDHSYKKWNNDFNFLLINLKSTNPMQAHKIKIRTKNLEAH